MRRLTPRLAVAVLTFAVGVAATLSWHVSSQAVALELPESGAERETKRAPLQGLTAEVPFCALVEYPEVFKNRIVRVPASWHLRDLTLALNATCLESARVVRVEFETEAARADYEKTVKAIDEGMKHCWLGGGNIVGRLELVSGADGGAGGGSPYRLMIHNLEEPDSIIDCAQTATPAK